MEKEILQVSPTHVITNGSMNPLITSVEQAFDMCPTTGDWVSLIWNCCVRLGKTDLHQYRDILNDPGRYKFLIEESIKNVGYKNHTNTVQPYEVNGKKYSSRGGALVAVGGADYAKLNLLELQDAVRTIGDWNGFKAATVISALDRMFNKMSYVGNDNPNTGMPFFEFALGNDSIFILKSFHRGKQYILAEDRKTATEYTPMDLRIQCELFKESVNADSCRMTEDGSDMCQTYEYKIWWD